MSDLAQKAQTADVLRHVADLLEQTKDLDYDPSQCDGMWVCAQHGAPECTEGDCSNLPWPEPNGDRVLAAFTSWADREFLRVVKAYDSGHVPEMPEESFRSYSVAEWPVGDLIEALHPLGQRG